MGTAAVTAPAASPRDHAAQAWNVLPPGQSGSVTFGRNATDQLKLYDGLAPLGGRVTDADIPRYFKRATLGLGTQKPARVERPRPGLTIQRDSFGVPHVVGRTRADVTFGAGWVTAQDRQLIIELLRGPGRIAALDVPGVNAFSLAVSGRAFEPSAEAERRLLKQVDLLLAQGAQGRQILRDIDTFVAGVNAWYRKTGLPIKPWARADVVAVAGLMGAVFGAGGGDETRRAQFLVELQRRLGAEQGRQVWEDLRQRDDPEARVAVEGVFPYNGRPTSEIGNTLVDPASFQAAGRGQETTRLPMSNALLVGAKRSATKRPLFVAGPQVGHFYPGILMELDLKGGGFDARGASFPGISFAVLLGRGVDYAWSATSAGVDLVDEYVETLCGSDTAYQYLGTCRQMTTYDAGVLKGRPGETDQRLVVRETVHGPVIGYATVDGRRVAISQRRSTYGRELLSAGFFAALSTNEVRSAQDFLRAAGKMELSFNWLYADDRDIAQFTSGRLPLRPPTVDSGLPTKGTGEYEWRGFLPASRHPQGVNPSDGMILNWNNKPARGFGGADDEWTWGAVQRADLLHAQIQARRTHTLGSVVAAMNAAATQDLRAVRSVPLLERVLARGQAPSPLAAQALRQLSDWRAKGGSRLDADLDGRIDHPGAAVLDAAWNRLADAALASVLGPLTESLARLVPRDEPMSPTGSSYYAGWWSYLDKDLRRLLGDDVRGAYGTRFCGAGDVGACASSLWAALDAAAKELAAAQGPDPAAWRADATKERIRFSPGLLPETMRGVNRPTFQQVMSFATHRPR